MEALEKEYTSKEKLLHQKKHECDLEGKKIQEEHVKYKAEQAEMDQMMTRAGTTGGPTFEETS